MADETKNDDPWLDDPWWGFDSLSMEEKRQVLFPLAILQTLNDIYPGLNGRLLNQLKALWPLFYAKRQPTPEETESLQLLQLWTRTKDPNSSPPQSDSST